MMLSAAPSVATSVNHDDFDAVYVEYVDAIYRFLYRRLGNREDAEDLTSEVFVKASRELDMTRSQASIASWLFTVARNQLADHWRRHYRLGALLPFDDELAQSADEDLPEGNGEKQIELVLAALPDRYRTVLELRFLRRLSTRETAELMGVNPDNVKVIQHRALARAAAQFSEPPVVETLITTMSTVEPEPQASLT